jgi:hypothetical protein
MVPTATLALITAARSRVSAGSSPMVRSALVAASKALAVAFLAWLVARPLFVPAARWRTVSGRVLPVISM